MMVVVIRELVLVSICNTSEVIWNQHRLNICRDNFGLKSGFGGGGIKSSSSQLPICRAGLQLNLPSGLGSDRKTEIRDRNIQNFSKKIIHNFVQKCLIFWRCIAALRQCPSSTRGRKTSSINSLSKLQRCVPLYRILYVSILSRIFWIIILRALPCTDPRPLQFQFKNLYFFRPLLEQQCHWGRRQVRFHSECVDHSLKSRTSNIWMWQKTIKGRSVNPKMFFGWVSGWFGFLIVGTMERRTKSTGSSLKSGHWGLPVCHIQTSHFIPNISQTCVLQNSTEPKAKQASSSTSKLVTKLQRWAQP